jgi:quercetin 2,3-dioxygenase
MFEIRRSDARGRADHGWLQSRHSFSFAEYYDPANVQYGVLRVLNEDRVAPGKGFDTHGHRDMEIVSYVLAGQLEHRDSMGNGSVIVPGDVQRMSAGTGVLHSERNPSASEPVHFLQIWIRPATAGGAPDYEQKHVTADARRGQLKLVVAPDGAGGAVRIRQDARIYAGLITGTERAVFALPPQRRAYLHVARGSLAVDGERLEAGDAVRVEDRREIVLDGGRDAEVLLFDLPAGR